DGFEKSGLELIRRGEECVHSIAVHRDKGISMPCEESLPGRYRNAIVELRRMGRDEVEVFPVLNRYGTIRPEYGVVLDHEDLGPVSRVHDRLRDIVIVAVDIE